MKQLTLVNVSTDYAIDCFVNNPKVSIKEAFIAGVEWQKEQYKQVQQLLKGIAEWAGNLPDEKLTTLTGAKDAALRGGKVADMRSIAVEAIRIFEPDYTPFEGYKHT